jgi:hypothetical protein
MARPRKRFSRISIKFGIEIYGTYCRSRPTLIFTLQSHCTYTLHEASIECSYSYQEKVFWKFDWSVFIFNEKNGINFTRLDTSKCIAMSSKTAVGEYQGYWRMKIRK